MIPAGMSREGRGYSAGMSEQSPGQVQGPADGATDNAAENAAPQVRGDVLGQGAQDGVSDDDRSPDGDAGTRAPGDTTQPRTGAETPVDAEDLVHARGQDVTDATLRRAQEDLDSQGPAAVEREVPGLDR